MGDMVKGIYTHMQIIFSRDLDFHRAIDIAYNNENYEFHDLLKAEQLFRDWYRIYY